MVRSRFHTEAVDLLELEQGARDVFLRRSPLSALRSPLSVLHLGGNADGVLAMLAAAMSKPIASEPKPVPIPKALQFVFGGAAGMAATCVVQPVDLIKTRMQLSALPGGAGVNMFVL